MLTGLKSRLRSLVRPSFGLAMVAVLALAGTATAAKLITGKQVKNSSLTGQDVKNRSLTAKDFKGSVRGPAGRVGSAGPTGGTGAQGPAGAKGGQGTEGIQGDPGATNVTITVETTPGVPSDTSAARNVPCPAGTKATGGGVAGANGGTTVDQVTASQPIGPSGGPTATTNGQAATGWFARLINKSNGAQDVNFFVVCASP